MNPVHISPPPFPYLTTYLNTIFIIILGTFVRKNWQIPEEAMFLNAALDTGEWVRGLQQEKSDPIETISREVVSICANSVDEQSRLCFYMDPNIFQIFRSECNEDVRK
jgi:hypothetical protein